MRINLIYILLFFVVPTSTAQESNSNHSNSIKSKTSIVILGTIQDAGSPHIGCTKDCCKDLFAQPAPDRQVVSLGLYDGENNKRYLFEATPDMPRQMKTLKMYGAKTDNELADGIFLTHAHIGHYSGLMYLGKEATAAKNVPVYAMPKMADYLKTNGPWSQLVDDNNINLHPLEDRLSVALSSKITITPFLVPHRDEYSETVGYKIKGPNKSALFIPDIDKWEKWDKYIIEEISKVDYAFLDATFYSGEEINNRDIAQIPHPFIIESMKKFEAMDINEKGKIIFIHFNHTNPVIDAESEEAKYVLKNGFRIAMINQSFQL